MDNNANIPISVQTVKEARLRKDPRVLITNKQELFFAAAQGIDRPLHPTLTILMRPNEERERLSAMYKKIREFGTLNPSTMLSTHASFDNEGKIKLIIPTVLIELGAEADILKTAQIYAKATGIKKPFFLRPSAVVNADNRTYAAPVLSISWGGTGLAIDFNGTQTAQLEEGNFGLLSPNMPHRSTSGCMAMFVAPTLYS